MRRVVTWHRSPRVTDRVFHALLGGVAPGSVTSTVTLPCPSIEMTRTRAARGAASYGSHVGSAYSSPTLRSACFTAVRIARIDAAGYAVTDGVGKTLLETSGTSI